MESGLDAAACEDNGLGQPLYWHTARAHLLVFHSLFALSLSLSLFVHFLISSKFFFCEHLKIVLSLGGRAACGARADRVNRIRKLLEI